MQHDGVPAVGVGDDWRELRMSQLNMPGLAWGAQQRSNPPKLVLPFGVHSARVLGSDKKTLETVLVDAAMVNSRILDGSRFRTRAASTLQAVIKACPGFPQHLALCVKAPGSASASRSTSPDGRAQADQHGQQQHGQQQLHGQASAVLGSTAGASSTSTSSTSSSGHWPNEAFPKEGRRYVQQGRRAPWHNDHAKVHGNSEWFFTFVCVHAPNGCPCRVVVSKPLGREELEIFFSHSCVHDPEGRPVGQLRGVSRAEAVEAMGGRTAASAHGHQLLARPASHRVDNTMSNTGASSQVLRQANSESKASSSGSVGQEGDIAAARARQEKGIRQDTRDAVDVTIRGDLPLVSSLNGSDFLVMRMSDSMLYRWLYARNRGCRGWWMDSTSGLVRGCVLVGRGCAAAHFSHLPCDSTIPMPLLPRLLLHAGVGCERQEGAVLVRASPGPCRRASLLCVRGRHQHAGPGCAYGGKCMQVPHVPGCCAALGRGGRLTCACVHPFLCSCCITSSASCPRASQQGQVTHHGTRVQAWMRYLASL